MSARSSRLPMFDRQIDRDYNGRCEARRSGARGAGGGARREAQGTGAAKSVPSRKGWTPSGDYQKE
jgi:hypothetical protein